jgi:hypothetical protein
MQIVYEGIIYQTENYQQGNACEAAAILVDGEPLGQVKVVFLSSRYEKISSSLRTCERILFRLFKERDWKMKGN